MKVSDFAGRTILQVNGTAIDPARADKQDTANTALASLLTLLAGQATAAKQDVLAGQINALLGYSDGIEGGLASIYSKLSGDPASQTTLAAVATSLGSILAKLSSDPATQTTLNAVLAKLSSDPATQTTLSAVLTKLSGDPATQTTSAAILGKLTSDPATSAKQDTGNTALASLVTALASQATAALQGTGNTALANILAKLSGDPATQTTSAAILGKLTSDPATSAKQDTGNTALASLVTALASQATAALQGTGNTALANILAKLSGDPATQTTLAAILAKLTADPATQTTLAALATAFGTAADAAATADTGTFGVNALIKRQLANDSTALTAISATSTWQSTVVSSLSSILSKLGAVVIAAGANVIGKVGLQVGGIDISTSAPLPVQSVPATLLTPSETSGAINTGGTAQPAIAANSNRKALSFQNTNATGDMRVSAVGTASATVGVLVPPKGLYEWRANETPTGAISVYHATTGATYWVKESV